MTSAFYRTSALLAAATIAACVLALVATTDLVEATVPGQNGVIAYQSGPDSAARFTDSSLWRINPNGSGKEQLTDARPAFEPAWSADGTKIAFRLGAREGGSTEKIYTMDIATGSQPVKLTRLKGHYHDPYWFPNGRKIAFESDKALRNGNDIYVQRIRSDGEPRGEPIRMTTNGGDDPAVSPDGTKIAFSRYLNGAREIYVIRANEPEGADNPARKLIDTAGECSERGDQEPDWSPDGQKIVYHSLSTCTVGIYVTNTSGTREATRLAGGRHPSFSPDGQKIAYGSDHEIWVMDAEGRNQFNLTGDGYSVFDDSPAWQPLPNAAADMGE